MEKIDISFVIPVYNVERFVRSAIDSVIAQGLESYEIICVDDCSSDGSGAVIESLAAEKQNIRIIRNEVNRGVSYSRNRGIEEANGDYIWFVDGDDMLAEGVCRHFLRFAGENRADIVLGNYQRVPEETVNPLKPDLQPFEKRVKYVPDSPEGERMNAVWAGLFRRSFLIENDLRFVEGMIAQEDTLFYYEFSIKTDKIFKTDTICYCYRVRKGSVMNSRSNERTKAYFESMITMLNVYNEHLKKGDYTDKAILKDKILHSRENVAYCLASQTVESDVRAGMKIIKELGIYPYPLRTETFRGKNPLRGLLDFLLPIEPFFWLEHWIYAAIWRK
ncbi:glycosyltransferase [Ruminococcus sp.]|uniref:glycosyltransferase family 2 protein n=1 Tax=Ruminococcus sp. TaxID=41978 RepID=UPI0025FCE019|nr:glycosyltransferase [Ruminococcus sp.]MBR1431511.1 glycosyltransferase [Ruminococcus sp.]